MQEMPPTQPLMQTDSRWTADGDGCIGADVTFVRDALNGFKV